MIASAITTRQTIVKCHIKCVATALNKGSFYQVYSLILYLIGQRIDQSQWTPFLTLFVNNMFNCNDYRNSSDIILD